MTYQTLIVKDTRDVNKCWKWSIVVTLLCVVGTGLAVTFSFHSLLDNFNTNCISGAKLAFKTTDYTMSSTASPPSASAASAASNTSTEMPSAMSALGGGADVGGSVAPSPGDDSSRRWQLRQNYSEQFREHFEPIVVVDAKLGVNKLRRMTLASGLVMGGDEVRLEATVRQQLAHNEEDIEFFDSQMIDELNTFWGPMAPCEYISFVPLIEAIVAIVWVAMFMMCGNGGRSNETFVDEPWRIVLPAFVFFALMTVVSAIHLAVLLSRLAHFCAELKQNFHDQTVPCALLINQFSMNDEFVVPPSHNYVLAITFSWLRLVFWALSVAVMTARCFNGTDFELVDATPGNGNGTSRPPRALLNGYASESGGEEMADGFGGPKHTQPRQMLVHRALLSASAQPARDSGDDDDDDDDIEDESEDDTLNVQDAVDNVAVVVASGAVHVNGVEFRPSAQLTRHSGNIALMRPPTMCPAIVEEQQQQPTHQLGSNCRRLVNEIDQLRDAKPKRPKRQLDSKA